MQRPNATPSPNSSSPAKPQSLNLARGGQAVINGALVTAAVACTIEVAPGAFVLTGRALWRDRAMLRNPRQELYFSMIDAAVSESRFAEERFRLFALLSQVVAQERTFESQKLCTLCATALLAGNSEEAVEIAARLAAKGVTPRSRVPGREIERRSRHTRCDIARPGAHRAS